MSDISKNTPIGKYDKSDPRYLKVSEAEIARSKNKSSDDYIIHNEKSIKKSLLTLARMMQVLKRKLSTPDSEDLSHLPADEKEFYILLSKLAQKLFTLSTEDRSKDIEFINDLSSLWDTLKLAVDRRRKLKHAHTYLSLLNRLIEEIENYGAKEGSSLGFYLKEHRNTDWFPLPYLKMLFHLYKDSIETKEKSTLFAWQNGIEEILILVKNAD